MTFAINAVETGDKSFAIFKQAAISINGTAATPAAIQQVGASAAAAATTVTVLAGGASATGSAGAGAASVVAGQGTNANGQACSCQCLCGMNSFPPMAAVNNFGGFPGQLGA
jgi:hypothetical protein